jgi:tripartite-type tricarboxylate transporter receptor subunit TctC
MASALDHADNCIRIVASGTGGGNDVVARLLAQGLAQSLRQPVTVENVPGKYAAAKRVATARPDGRTLLLYGSGLWLAPLMPGKVPYDAVRDYAPVMLAARTPNVLVVHNSVAADSVGELIRLARARPAALKCGYSVPGGSPHLAAQLFNLMAGTRIATVACDDVTSLFADLRSGRIQMMFPNAAAAKRLLESGDVRALAVTSASRSRLFPRLPTLASTVRGYVSEAVFAILAPAGTPVGIIRKLHAGIAKFLRTQYVREAFFSIGIEVVASTPGQLAATIKRDICRMAEVLADI